MGMGLVVGPTLYDFFRQFGVKSPLQHHASQLPCYEVAQEALLTATKKEHSNDA